jgi:CheY-like chemotaxis protein
MQSTLIVQCSRCAARIKAPIQLLGQTRKCPGCGQPVMIRIKTPVDSEPLFLHDELPEAPSDGDSVRGNEKLILLVDDDRELNDALRSLLEKRGHRVLQAFDGVQAKAMIAEHNFDLMILDMMMPELGGYPLLEYLNDQSNAPPVIMITAKEGEQHRIYAEYLGVVDYLHKPFPIDRLLESVEKNLARRESSAADTLVG